MAELRKARLETWKEVAGFFGKDERTVKRWEAERGLPVHRLPGVARSRIYVEVRELEQWLRGETDAGQDEPVPDPAPARRTSKWDWRILAGVAISGVLAASAVGLVWLHPSPKPPAVAPASAQPASLAAQRLYLAGMDDWSRRTPDSLHRAVDEFTQAIRLSPRYAEAYVGLANCYNLLREFTLMPASQAYPLARAAAEHALALNSRLASAHVALAFVDSYWVWDLPAARREYAEAIALEPNSDLNHHWFATFLSAQAEFTRSLAEFAKAEALNPTSLAIKSDHGVVLYEAGRRAEGMAMLLAVEKTDPKFLSPHRYLSGLYLLDGRDKDFLRESEIAAQLTDDRQRQAMVAIARDGLERGGHNGMLKALLDEDLRQYRYGAVPAYAVAGAYALIGKTDQALDYLQASIERREENAAQVQSDPAFAPMRSLPRYRMLVARIAPSRELPQSL